MNEEKLEKIQFVRPLSSADFVNTEITLSDKLMYIDNIKSKILVDAGHIVKHSMISMLVNSLNPHAVVITSPYQYFSKIVSKNIAKYLNNVGIENVSDIVVEDVNNKLGTRTTFDYNAKVMPNPFVLYDKSKYRPSISSFTVIECIGILNETEILGVVYNSKFSPIGCTVFKDMTLILE